MEYFISLIAGPTHSEIEPRGAVSAVAVAVGVRSVSFGAHEVASDPKDIGDAHLNPLKI
jgi:hypothetical protein